LQAIFDVLDRFHDGEHIGIAARIVLSTDRLTRTPARKKDPTGVMPKPVRSSV
jgi:hypothetical protein